MIAALVSASFVANSFGAPSGLVGTMGIRILNTLGGTVVARTTAGITEGPAGSGNYFATITAPPTPGLYFVYWDSGGSPPASSATEELVVTAAATSTTTYGNTTAVLANGASRMTMKQHDTRPKMQALLAQDGSPIDLTGATVKLLAAPALAGGSSFTGSCVIVSPTTGVVSYAFTADNTVTATTFNVEFEITFADGGIQTLPNSGYLQLEIKPDLG